MKDHKKVAEAIRDALISLPSTCNAHDELGVIKTILNVFYGEGDKPAWSSPMVEYIDNRDTPSQKQEAPLSAKMNSDRIKEIQADTAYPNSVSVQQALLKVWNECMHQYANQSIDVNKLATEIWDKVVEYKKYGAINKHSAITTPIQKHLKR